MRASVDFPQPDSPTMLKVVPRLTVKETFSTARRMRRGSCENRRDSAGAETSKRQEAADFSAPYFTQWVVAAVRPDSKVATLADLKGKRVAVMKGSSHFEFLPSLKLEPEIRLTGFNMESYTAVLEGQSDYALMDSKSEVGQPVSDQFADLKVGVRIRPSEQGVMVRKGSDLKSSLDAYIEGLRKSGELEKLLAKYGEGPAIARK